MRGGSLAGGGSFFNWERISRGLEDEAGSGVGAGLGCRSG
jgi:hypothetical protein